MTGAVVHCSTCGAELLPGDRFCEQCGSSLPGEGIPTPESCLVCGSTDPVDADGYCPVCGARGRDADDRAELDLAAAAAVTDRGRVHRRNEDAFALELPTSGGFAAVVCDGISSASAGDAAARTAARAAVEVLVAAVADSSCDLAETIGDAVSAAVTAVGTVEWTTRAGRETPSCTLVAAAARDGGEIVVASVGDSRAYWVDSSGTTQLTVDDSWATAQVAAGLMTEAEALADARSHTITHWIGPDAPDRGPRVARFAVPGAGRLVLCSDGLWNYLSRAEELGELIAALPDAASAAAVARALADVALRRGGRDNITIAIIDQQGEQS